MAALESQLVAMAEENHKLNTRNRELELELAAKSKEIASLKEELKEKDV